MATITASMVKDLRESTGAGMMDCKQALTENSGDMQAAIDWLMAAKVRASNVIPRKHVIMRGFAGFLPLPHLLPFSG